MPRLASGLRLSKHQHLNPLYKKQNKTKRLKANKNFYKNKEKKVAPISSVSRKIQRKTGNLIKEFENAKKVAMNWEKKF